MKLAKLVTVIAKIAEICYWIGSGMTAAIVIGIIAGNTSLISALSSVKPESGKDLAAFGFSISTTNPAGNTVWGSYLIFFITLLAMLLLMAMVCRNVCLIFKTTEGKTKFSKGKTPFQPANIRMVRQIGFFLIAMPVIGLIMSVIAKAALAASKVECSMDLHFIVIGLVVICLARIFAYGMELQNDVDGLV